MLPPESATLLSPESVDQALLDHADRRGPVSMTLSAARPRRAIPIAIDDKDPVVRVRRELALWVGPRMQEIRDVIERAARVDVTVLVTGETGTGKELVARAVHYLGARRKGPFVKVNCAAVARELLESELFGHERGAFTGAHQLKVGKFEAAHQGTIFLDEIGDLHPGLQAKLLHVLEDGQFSRVGARSSIDVDVRVVAATNQDLERAVQAGHFREDLFYRLNVLRVRLPPLRERTEEIPLLAGYFAERYARAFRRDDFTVPPHTVDRLLHHRFPGNVRELENIIKCMIVLGDPDLTRGSVPGKVPAPSARIAAAEPLAPAMSLRQIARGAARAAERTAIVDALQRTQWNRVRAAKLLRTSYRSLLYKIKEGGLDPRQAGAEPSHEP